MFAPLFAADAPDPITSFTLKPQSPRLAPAAGFLPMSNPDGTMERIRMQAVTALSGSPPLYKELRDRGFTVPGIIHSTFARFVRTPADPERLLAGFDAIAADTQFSPQEIGEILLTLETKPYMRGGEVLHRFKLGSNRDKAVEGKLTTDEHR